MGHYCERPLRTKVMSIEYCILKIFGWCVGNEFQRTMAVTALGKAGD